ncbi:ABC-type oligopeptide transport system ATPase subunit [Rhizobium sp. BK212]|uniref:ABC transporter ATP-binding protein n=1 Tax=Rhizobium sp. BK212 TaxID=2587074 RepID=UPI001839AC77|nr:hypothetical protein [Rhizobium sp. BK212]MBB4218798.1 ABC-type oligopeptide transport system ATPase subunit [Rhizobium sp. BK212]
MDVSKAFIWIVAGKTDQLVNNPAHDYPRALLSAIPHPDPRDRLILTASAMTHPYDFSQWISHENYRHQNHRLFAGLQLRRSKFSPIKA